MIANVSYGNDVASEPDVRLCGDVASKRVIELGIGPVSNAVALAQAGAKTIVIDPSAEHIASVRREADAAEVRVECHQSELADLSFVTSASVDLVLASHTVDAIDDLPRLLRQVHRVLRPGSAFVVAMRHPVAVMFDGTAVGRSYGSGGTRTFAELFMAFERANMHLDVIHELEARGTPQTPAVLVLRGRKQGT